MVPIYEECIKSRKIGTLKTENSKVEQALENIEKYVNEKKSKLPRKKLRKIKKCRILLKKSRSSD